MRKVRRKALVSQTLNTELSKKHIEYHCTQTEKHHTIIFLIYDGWHYMAVREQYNGNLVFF